MRFGVCVCVSVCVCFVDLVSLYRSKYTCVFVCEGVRVFVMYVSWVPGMFVRVRE